MQLRIRISITSAQLAGWDEADRRFSTSPRSPFRRPSPLKLIDECAARRFAGRRDEQAGGEIWGERSSRLGRAIDDGLVSKQVRRYGFRSMLIAADEARRYTGAARKKNATG